MKTVARIVPQRYAQFLLRMFENVVPNARLQMALHFRQIKV